MKRGDPAIAVGYLRVSTDEQHLGPEAQREAIGRWAEARNVDVVEWYEDKVSGAAALDARPGFLAALDALVRLGAGVLVAHRRDRLARDVIVAAQVEQLVKRTGARLETADGAGAGDGPEAALFRRLLDTFAEYERLLIRSRTRNALAVRRRRGERFSGRAPIGSRFAGSARLSPRDPPQLLEVDEVEVQALARMRRLQAKGLSLAAIARVLNAAGVRPRGAIWHKTTVARALARRPT